ncbi:MAG: SUMF1/EgtB/PvdO family nonheme iron enzyme [Planctomycetes bacterium]|nr:SUMF1/EgtB/PvdO family nonheme iron enzyme [Planctomycetota bacterium]
MAAAVPQLGRRSSGARPCAARRAAAALALAVAALAVGCGDDSGRVAALADTAAAWRTTRFGVLRDLVLFARPERSGGPFLLDRFESTRGDWEAWLAGADRPVEEWARFDAWNPETEDALPVVGVSLGEAMRYAEWRCLRLPRLDEWDYAATAGSRYRLPWGDAERSAWANTQELRLGHLVPVGTFESGRQRDGPYDLVGNAAEWTVTPKLEVLLPAADATGRVDRDVLDFGWRTEALRRNDALRPFAVAGRTFGLVELLLVDDRAVPRRCAAGLDRPMTGSHLSEGHFWAGAWRLVDRRPGERSTTLGFRLATDPGALLARLARDRRAPSAAEELALRAFLGRPELRELMRAQLRVRPWLLDGAGPLGPILRDELAP